MFSSRLFLMFAFTFMIALGKSVPIKDTPSFIPQSVDSKEIISTIFNTNKRFIVPVKISYDDGNISTSVVVVNLRVENDKLIINNDVSLKLGKTSVQVIEAKVIPADISKDEIDDYFDNYDIALVTVEISSSVRSIPKKIDNLIINRVIISITVMQIDGVEVAQAKAIEKILEIKQIRQSISPSSDEFSNYYQIVKHHHHRSPCKNIIAHVEHWYCSKFTKVLFTSALLTFISGIFYIIVIRYRPLIKIYSFTTKKKEFSQPQ